MKSFALLLTLLIIFISSCDPNWRARVVEQITEVELQKSQLESAGKSDSLYMLLADEYVGIYDSGSIVSKKEFLKTVSTENKFSSESSIAGLEIIPLRPQYAMSRGILLSQSLHYGTFTKTDSLRFTSVWKKHKGHWKLVSYQCTMISDPEDNRSSGIDFTPNDLSKFSGAFVLSTNNPLEINIKHTNSRLELVIPSHMEKPKQLIPISEDEFRLVDEKWEIEFISQDSISFITWGSEIGGKRL